MPTYSFRQLDVFAGTALRGNPLAVVCGADGLSDATMAAFAAWTNLSETVFLLRPRDPAADYRVRIFMPDGELPFAGHPTLGACAAWLAEAATENGGTDRMDRDVIVQECGLGMVPVRRAFMGQADMLAFRAPPLLRSGPVEPSLLARIVAGLGLDDTAVRDASWADNGPGWIVLRLGTRAQVMAARPDYTMLAGLNIGLVAPADGAAGEAAFEVRAFCASADDGTGFEDPVTGSLNAAIGQWLIASGIAPPDYVAAQGSARGRDGRVRVARAEDGAIWVGGRVVPHVVGRVDLPA